MAQGTPNQALHLTAAKPAAGELGRSAAEGARLVKVNPHHVMALRRLTDLPVSECRDLLGAAGGDLLAAVQHLRQQSWCALDEGAVVAVLGECGVAYTPPAPRRPVILPDAEVIADLTACGTAMAEYFLIDGLVCSVNACGELMGCAIDDADLAASAKVYLRRLGVPEYPSLQAFREQRHAEPGRVLSSDDL